jgi:hypothetical protein
MFRIRISRLISQSNFLFYDFRIIVELIVAMYYSLIFYIIV